LAGFPALVWQRLVQSENDTVSAATQLLAQTAPVEASAFERLTHHYNQFLSALVQLEKDLLLEECGIDVATGLRNKQAMQRELGRELDRLARQGLAFSIILVRIDSYDKMQAALPEEERLKNELQCAGILKQSLRGIDDAYAIGDGEFILSIKQTGVSGAIRMLERLRDIVGETHVLVPLGEGFIPLTMSYCAGEPIPGDPLADFLKELRRDLRENAREPGTVLKYHEVSAIKRFTKPT
jgi:diguanylate cyclase (GGDEF)-like protein